MGGAEETGGGGLRSLLGGRRHSLSTALPASSLFSFMTLDDPRSSLGYLPPPFADPRRAHMHPASALPVLNTIGMSMCRSLDVSRSTYMSSTSFPFHRNFDFFFIK